MIMKAKNQTQITKIKKRGKKVIGAVVLRKIKIQEVVGKKKMK